LYLTENGVCFAVQAKWLFIVRSILDNQVVGEKDWFFGDKPGGTYSNHTAMKGQYKLAQNPG